MKKLLLLCAIALSVSACTEKQNSDSILAQKQEQAMQDANSQIGMPAIKNFQERKLMKMIFELRDQANVINYAYLFSEMTGKLIYLGKCLGYGLPYATQFTNPQKADYNGGNGGGNITLPQADPNGLFMPSSANGTWVMLINPKTNQAQPVFVEPNVIVSPFPLEVQ